MGAKPAQHAYAKTASGDLGQPFWLCLAARVGAVSRPVLGSGPPGVFDSLRSPWGAGYCRGGGVRGRRAAGILALFCWRHFLVSSALLRTPRLCPVGGRGVRGGRGAALTALWGPWLTRVGLAASQGRWTACWRLVRDVRC